MSPVLNRGHFTVREGSKVVHRFKANIASMTAMPDGRIVVVLNSAKAYISNKTLTRWRKL